MVDAIVEFDYKAQHDDELTITVGDIISNIRKDEGGWWEGEVGGRRGLFPDNFVREIKKEVKKETSQSTQTGRMKSDLSNGSSSPGSSSESLLRPAMKGNTIRRRRCKVAFSYLPQNEDELELKIGDIIEILGEVEEGWWEGTLHGKIGMFPSNFTKELLSESDDPPTPQEEVRSARTSVKDSTGSESDGGDSSSARSDAGSVASGSEFQHKKVRGFGFGDIFKDQPIKLRPRSIDVNAELEKQQVMKKGSLHPVAQENMKTEPDGKMKVKECCKVIFPYEGQNKDELSIKEGDIVTIISKECADTGWWLGELNGRQGVFPDNFVKLLVSEVEKERPKKPPPPATPVMKQNSEKKADSKKVPPERPESLPQRVEEKVGEEVRTGDLPKTALPAIPPKKPLPPHATNSLGRPSSLPPRRPERPAGPATPCESPRSEGGGLTSERSNDIDVEDFDSIVSSTEKLNHPTVTRPRMPDRRPRSQLFTASSLSSPDLLDIPFLEEQRGEKEKEELDSSSSKSANNAKRVSKTVPNLPASESKCPLPPKPTPPASSSSGSTPPSRIPAPSANAQRPSSPSVSEAKRESLVLEELKAQLRDLRAAVELMESQHRKEIKQLNYELDEEKKIRLSLQMEVEHIKKVLSK